MAARRYPSAMMEKFGAFICNNNDNNFKGSSHRGVYFASCFFCKLLSENSCMYSHQCGTGGRRKERVAASSSGGQWAPDFPGVE